LSKILIRRRFPNFICDGMPLGPEEEKYRHEINSTEEFFEIDWVKEKMENKDFKEWKLSSEKQLILGQYSDGSWNVFAYLLEGELDLPICYDE